MEFVIPNSNTCRLPAVAGGVGDAAGAAVGGGHAASAAGRGEGCVRVLIPHEPVKLCHSCEGNSRRLCSFCLSGRYPTPLPHAHKLPHLSQALCPAGMLVPFGLLCVSRAAFEVRVMCWKPDLLPEHRCCR